MLILPAIDLMQGKCVRLRQGDFSQQTTYTEPPADVAKRFCDAGLTQIHVVDLEGAKSGAIRNWEAIEAILATGASVEVGGGIRTSDDIRKLVGLGACRVILGSVAAKSPELLGYWVKQFGAEKIVVGIDVRNNRVAVGGWMENSLLTPASLMPQLIQQGAATFICTDISHDGLLHGPNVEFFRSLRMMFPDISLIASGGVATIADVHALRALRLQGVVIGRAIYEGTLSLEELKPLAD
ncbi:MAG: 1-(5-phosphoribosyl)-5-[(5-phosphoribosylamino)methylideneamino]imidazole-4-carboxamide isomerase [Ignavibacteriales bacterium]|nr:1-(5-phosphoribosyl)-5-[(5-phosphoribosylamino)methylideneamino]imidazole-4-carboxamide isomerase [Ignavibacteriales bacterium]